MRYVIRWLIAAVCLAAASAQAAVLHVSPQGRLLGASEVVVGGSVYDVTFQEGSCVSLFAPCDNAGFFAFQTVPAIHQAIQALGQQVFVGIYDVDPALTFGCANASLCGVFTPWGYFVTDVGPRMNFGYVINYAGAADHDLGTTITHTTFDTTNDPRYVFAIWTQTGNIPEPPLGLAVLVALVLLLRRS